MFFPLLKKEIQTTLLCMLCVGLFNFVTSISFLTMLPVYVLFLFVFIIQMIVPYYDLQYFRQAKLLLEREKEYFENYGTFTKDLKKLGLNNEKLLKDFRISFYEDNLNIRCDSGFNTICFVVKDNSLEIKYLYKMDIHKRLFADIHPSFLSVN